MGLQYKIRDTAIKTAYAAGDLLRRNFYKKQTATKFCDHDIKLEIDQQSETLIKTCILSEFPDHTILSEESGRDEPAIPGGYTWVVDPLDGSVNFYCGIPYFSVCIACYKTIQTNKERELQPFVGVVYAPLTDDLYAGIAGEESQCNGRPLKVSSISKLQDAITGISFGSDEKTMERMESLNRILLRRTRKVRIFGSTALDLVKIADGRLGALIQGRVRLWDFAAARVILEQSGGIVKATKVDNDSYQILACAPDIYTELKTILKNNYNSW
jgi:fructose-1,6-bisphosphatase/inositol monophosphatase family enzyme